MSNIKLDYNCPSKRLTEKDGKIIVDVRGENFEAVFEEVAPGVWEEITAEEDGE